MKVKGIDVSYVQQKLNYAEVVNSGVKFVIIRAGIAEKKDMLFDYHTKNCKSYNLDYGFYWYSKAQSVEQVEKEANACINTIKGLYPNYPIFFDMEEQTQTKLGKQLTTDIAIAFCKAINKGGYPCGIYTNPSWLEYYYDKSRLVGKFDIWLAHWTGSPNKETQYNYNQVIRQWGIDSIAGMDIDGDICFIDYPAKTQNWYANNAPQHLKPDEGETPNGNLRKGDKVSLKNAPLYGSSTIAKKANTITGTYYIHSDGIINGRIRITTPKGNTVCTGWVNAADCKLIDDSDNNNTTQPTTQSKFKIGDKVKVKQGATAYNGEKLNKAVYDIVYDVLQVGTSTKPDYIVIGLKGQITAAVKEKDLIKQ